MFRRIAVCLTLLLAGPLAAAPAPIQDRDARIGDVKLHYLEAGAGNLQRGGMLQYGGRVNKDLTYRAYVNGYEFSPFENANGTRGVGRALAIVLAAANARDG